MLKRRRKVGLRVRPARADRRRHRLGVRARLVAAPHPAPRVAAVEDEAADPLGMPHRVRRARSPRPARRPSSVKRSSPSASTTVSRSATQVLHRELAELVVGEPAAALVVADERVAVAELGQPVTPDRALPVEVEMRQPGRRPHDRRPAAVDGVREPHPVASGAEADLLRHGLDLTLG